MSKYESKIYNDYIKSNKVCSFEDYLFDEYNLMEFYFEQSEDWSSGLGKLLCEIHESGLLIGTEFENKTKDIYMRLDV